MTIMFIVYKVNKNDMMDDKIGWEWNTCMQACIHTHVVMFPCYENLFKQKPSSKQTYA